MFNMERYEIFSAVLEDANKELRAVHHTMNISRIWHKNPTACLRLDEREAELCWWVGKLNSLCALYKRKAV